MADASPPRPPSLGFSRRPRPCARPRVRRGPCRPSSSMLSWPCSPSASSVRRRSPPSSSSYASPPTTHGRRRRIVVRRFQQARLVSGWSMSAHAHVSLVVCVSKLHASVLDAVAAALCMLRSSVRAHAARRATVCRCLPARAGRHGHMAVRRHDALLCSGSTALSCSPSVPAKLGFHLVKSGRAPCASSASAPPASTRLRP